MTEQKKRIIWIDVVKFFGIFAIYIGHYAESVGLSYHFVFAYHVPLFFLISGCMESGKGEQPIFQYIRDKFMRLLVPFFVFSFLSISVYMLVSASHFDILKSLIVHTFFGVIRNHFIANSLWFITCLFVISVMFAIIRKVKKKFFILVIGIVMYLVATNLMVPSPIIQPSWLYNVDSAIYYMIYYIIGFVTFPFILKLFEMNSFSKKMCFIVSGIMASIYSVLLFFEIDLLKSCESVWFFGTFVPIVRALIVIWFNFVVAYLCRNILLFATLGKNTLYLCGSEYLVKTIIPVCANILGFQITTNDPLAIYIYCFFLICFVYRFFVPVEKMIIEKVHGILRFEF